MNPLLTESVNPERKKIDIYGDVFAECFDVEFFKLQEKESSLVFDRSFQMFITIKLHTFFMKGAIKNLVNEVFENTTLRDFILSLTDRFSIYANSVELSEFVTLEKLISSGIGEVVDENKGPLDDDLCFIPKQVYDNIEIDTETIYKILMFNKWITTVVMISLFFYKTKAFNNVVNLSTPLTK